ncbi:SusC/RagA family TonB-linked outer membrane protein [Butyricimonas sp. NSJ-56]|uniref:SusC/RagA family TonB-linked outer membrane protein n=2 Tax=Butyricimonas hominis TaxID=2763032 RepID=A0ABR7D4N9_9BACT|nr:SusC/RagA family TonB-linked outer membrane protein [Butyricimonas hominis]
MKKKRILYLSGAKQKFLNLIRVMRITIFLLLVGLTHVSASVFSQNTSINLKLKDVKLEQVVKIVQKQLNQDFFFNRKDIDVNKKISVNFVEASLEDVVREVFGERYTYEIVDNIIVISTRQVVLEEVKKVVIKGIVTDQDSVPLPGVTIKIKNLTFGTVTNGKGEYELVLPEAKDVVLVFSFIGMKTVERKYTGEKVINVLMEESSTEMEEVVVTTGYETFKKKRLTSAITTLKAEDIMVSGLSSIDQMLEGHVPDMMFMVNSGEVGVVPKIRIRGTSTLIGNREPLWVVDGIVVNDPVPVSPDELNDPDYVNRIGNAIAGINPQDIDQINILKDASATALYGAKAANGVILITTKKGHAGKMIVNYNVNMTLKRRPRYSDRRIDVMDSKERMAFSRDLVKAHYKYAEPMTEVGYEGLINQLYRNEIDYEQFQVGVNELESTNTDWFDLLTEDSFSHQHTLSLTGGTDKVRYYSSVGYTRDNDVIKGNRNERYTVAINLDATLSQYLSTSFSLKGNVGNREYNQTAIAPMDYAYNTSRAIPAFDKEGRYYFYKKNVNMSEKYNYNILNELKHSSYKQDNAALQFNASLDFKLKTYLTAQALFSYSTANTDIEGYYDEQTYYAAKERRSDYGVEPDENTTKLPFGGELQKDNTRNSSYTFRLQVNFNKYFGVNEQHNVNAVIGYEMSSTEYNGYSNVTRGYYPDRGKQFAVGTSLEAYPAYRAWIENNAYPNMTDNITNLVAGYATLAYTYMSYFTINANARVDGSNKFGDKSNDKLLPVWSVAGIYNVSEHWRNAWNGIDFLSLKCSYGFQGNMLDEESPEMTISKKPVDPYYNELISKVINYPNPQLKWERTSSLNTGIEIGFFKRRVQLSAEYYLKRTKDAFLSKPISTVNGRNQYVVNSGNVRNSGYSIGATITPVVIRDFKWTLSTYFSKTFNKLKTKPGAEQYELSNFLSGTALVKGKPVGTFYSYKFIGLNPEDGGPVFDDGQEENEKLENLSKYDTYTKVLEASGTREPTMSGGVNNTFKYRNLLLQVNLSYSLGSKIRLFKMYNGAVSWDPEKNVNREFIHRWKQSGDEVYTDVPGIISTSSTAYRYYNDHWSNSRGYNGNVIAQNYWDMYNYGSQRVVSGNYLKCTNLSFTYEFPDWLLGKWRLTRLAASFSATNMFTICSSKLKGQTPTQGGFAEIQLSERPTYSLGINVSF